MVVAAGRPSPRRRWSSENPNCRLCRARSFKSPWLLKSGIPLLTLMTLSFAPLNQYLQPASKGESRLLPGQDGTKAMTGMDRFLLKKPMVLNSSSASAKISSHTASTAATSQTTSSLHFVLRASSNFFSSWFSTYKGRCI